MNSLRLPRLTWHEPKTIDQLVALKKDLGPAGVILAGGTDVVPLLKRRNIRARQIISLKSAAGLRELSLSPGTGLTVGAAVTLRDLSDHPAVAAHYPALVRAARAVAFNQIRNRATLGGNVCLDNKCSCFNQSELWWRSREDCLKRGGRVCHLVKGGQKCFALSAGDTVPALIALAAEAVIHGPEGPRRQPVQDLYSGDGARPLSLDPAEVLVGVHLPLPPPGRRAGFIKKSLRGAVDFGLADVAVCLDPDQPPRIALGAVSTGPVRVVKTEEFLAGRGLTPAALAEAADILVKEVKPLSLVGAEPPLRRAMLRAAFEDLLVGLMNG